MRIPAVRVHLVIFDGCPNVAAAHEVIAEASERARVEVSVEVVNLDAEEVSSEFYGYPSPTVLVEGDPVGAVRRGEAMSCATDGAPSVDAVVEALGRAAEAAI